MRIIRALVISKLNAYNPSSSYKYIKYGDLKVNMNVYAHLKMAVHKNENKYSNLKSNLGLHSTIPVD